MLVCVLCSGWRGAFWGVWRCRYGRHTDIWRPSTKSANTRAQVAGSSLGEDGGDFRGDAGFSPQGGVSRKLKGGAAGIWSAAGFAWRGLALEPIVSNHSSIPPALTVRRV